ncbi:alpha/beta fold hydrolase [Amycolatopsis sp. NPDC058986]|uniref:alpha/beta fold hydrolase n=1 Tax=unclassified Amycolatopsis TaxID=2618356 RepID=UPI003671D2DE
MTEVSTVVSADGTKIAFERRGAGTPLILIGGAVNDRTTVAGLAEVLDGYTTIAYDRRGRGDSGDAETYSVDREVEDLAALIEHVGGSAHVFGHSSGAVLALEAASRGLSINRVAAYEPPYIVDGSRPRPGDDLVDRVRAALDAGDCDEAVTLFLVEGTDTPAGIVAGMKTAPVWGWFTALAHTLPYDLTICGPGNHLPVSGLAKITVPTLVIGGGASPAWMPAGARAAAEAVPGGVYQTLEGQDHGVLQHPKTLLPLLTDFYG